MPSPAEPRTGKETATKVLILGAGGQVSRHATRALLETTDAELTLYLRRASRLPNPDPGRARVVEGDVLDAAALRDAVGGQDVVFASLDGDLPRMARAILDAMRATGVTRLVFVSSMGIYGEVPGERYRSVLDPYRDAAALIEVSDLDWTVLRPGWFTADPDTRVRLTQKGEPFVGHDVPLAGLGALAARLATTPSLHVRESLGVSQA